MTIERLIEIREWLVHPLAEARDFRNDPELLALIDAEIGRQTTGGWTVAYYGRHECSGCHNYAPSFQNGDENLTPFCPHCGRKMNQE